jgi:5-methylcytosine-specific restriction endonuclease McrA
MDPGLRLFVRQRAHNCCEYCGISQEDEPLIFHVEHVIPRKHQGADSADNLALACHHCNLRKGSNLSGLDPKTGLLTRLFNPRRDAWNEHFEVAQGEVGGRTEIGRTTVMVLDMNNEGRVELRTGG